MIQEWKELLWKELLMDGKIWRMEEKENGDLHFTASIDVRMAVMPLPPGDPHAPPYTYVAPWPLDPNAPVVDDNHGWDEDE